ncbi:DUF2642 domain-containing protein [Alicyclobacillus acidoterrestris]|uniref:YuzF family protein n=1 Tax=Alicyclobacillus acidoterrestris (strain ATCC 49025 / DSM 3922 / CIP 106132 / NCIMB 13137 / GD3B) TaxID=1356854 RepID=T0D7D3_ALIAG|nr:DUF2642 domain-containing protein [Alicyclobacillus acidoterrestris]EPZ47412.1 hypothetical protein N007_06265 [Alicyclobacillus acidoterrestris ATCC 49025]UNO48309.1 YuzF family protein [Alicyclobacillus acidoterrestris]
MARLRLPGDTPAERAQQLIDAVQQGLANSNANLSASASGSITVGGTNILQSLENLLANLLGGSTGGNPAEPASIRQVLLNNLNRNVVISTAFEPVTGTIIAVERDYVVVVETTSNLVLIPIAQIGSVTPA